MFLVHTVNSWTNHAANFISVVLRCTFMISDAFNQILQSANCPQTYSALISNWQVN